jgi:hypothetical protein
MYVETEVDIGCFLGLLSIFYVEAGSFAETRGLHLSFQLFRIASVLQGFPVSASLALALQTAALPLAPCSGEFFGMVDA